MEERNSINVSYEFENKIDYIHTTDIFDDTATHNIQLHDHNVYELYFLLSGKVTYYIEGIVYHLIPGDILAISDKELHRATIDSLSNYERITIFLNKDYITSLSTERTDLTAIFHRVLGGKSNGFIRAESDLAKKINNIILKIEFMLKSNAYGKDVLLSSYVSQLLVSLNSMHYAQEKEDNPNLESDSTFNKILMYINEDLSRNIKLYDVAEKFFISQYHLTRKFREYTGFTFHNYVQSKRMILAQHLLSQNLPTQIIISRCGYNDYSSFVRAFTAKFGISPKKYLQKMKLQDENNDDA